MAALLFQKYKQACESRNIKIGKLCDEAGVSRMTLSKWKKKDPMNIEIMLKLDSALKKFPIQSEQ